MSIYEQIASLISLVPVHTGYAPTGARLPYVAIRPLIIDDVDTALSGDSLGWDFQFSLYCCGGSVSASYNLALSVMQELTGTRVGGTTLSTSMGYSGAQVEGHYESQVTVQLNQGGI